MSNLVLELRQGEIMIVNGAPIRFRTKSRIELTAKARFLFGKQIMPPDQADSPGPAHLFRVAIRLYRLDRGTTRGLESARRTDRRIPGSHYLGSGARDPRRALAAAEADDCYQALKLARRIIRHEDSVLGRVPSPTRPMDHAQVGATTRSL